MKPKIAHVPKFLEDFKEFAMRGNVIDLAVGVIIGGAFGKITTSLVNDIIMPPIGLVLGKVDFANLYLNISGGSYSSLQQAQQAGAVTINYGSFINILINFTITALVIFILIKYINSLRRTEEGAKKNEPTTKKCPYCLETIAIKATRCSHCTSKL
ncbi:large conductance mechanosensitive channel protein MscL [candidate division WWE3 bacterium CG10_big_fil_rev_8_21_14_0_10_32_10]|uniref:Large-conductance mechanosensitive channel n=1 Tax=candidate division WWE3 bacterium CG10_big_fil_rev_8_21_14_0_10_32_10 TaxID=1975090 RepID=A0A2H0RCS0_UNCKA|nr:MAG: large conductance mechanosensitive channel protein MscL [candidate division WWE3 bacterium CG10_big_fil_rev_8_21_14_0_10_32_10]